MSKIILVFLAFILAMSFVSAGCVTEQNAEIKSVNRLNSINLWTTCSDCDSVNITQINYPNGVNKSLNYVMSKNGFVYNYIFTNTEQVGRYSYITVGNSVSNGICIQSVSFDVKSLDLSFSIMLILISLGLAMFGFFGKNEWITIIGGLIMIPIGIYFIYNGIDIYKSILTEIISITMICLGAFFTIFTGIEIIEENL
jgi:hypothetical protein